MEPYIKNMINKRIKNEQWCVKELIDKINNQEIFKPQFQRKKKWDIQPKRENTPNIKNYIKFLLETENSVHAITFGQDTTSHKIRYSNIDGNNRINAINLFVNEPLKVFPEYLEDIKNFIDTLSLDINDKNTFKNFFEEISYNDLMNFKYRLFFKDKGHEEFYKKIKTYREDFEDQELIEKLQTKLKTIKGDNFDASVKINVNLFEGHNTDELSKLFEDINKYSSTLTESEILASSLYNVTNFVIDDKKLELEYNIQVKLYYTAMAAGEVLECYNFSNNKSINAYEYMVGLQNYCNSKYGSVPNVILKSNQIDIFFFKLWEILYNSYNGNTFTTKNVNDFSKIIIESCRILKETIDSIFTDKINEKLFNKTCLQKMDTLKKNNLILIIISIIGFIKKNKDKDVIINKVEICLLYHFMLTDLIKENNEESAFYRIYDTLNYKAGGTYIENLARQIFLNPEIICNKITKEIFGELLDILLKSHNNPCERKIKNGKHANDRRKLKFFEKTLMFYYYKENIPINQLYNNFSLEHICPNSCDWEGFIDKDRTGNLIPIISTINSSRGNRHISEYSNTDEGKTFCNFIKDVIPCRDLYDKIVSHNNKKPVIIDNDLYNKMCLENEQKYKNKFIDLLFKLR
jgi:hypothetical protein